MFVLCSFLNMLVWYVLSVLLFCRMSVIVLYGSDCVVVGVLVLWCRFVVFMVCFLVWVCGFIV